MTITKNLFLNWYSSMKKIFRKIRMIFDIENWLWKSDLGTFWQPMWTSVKVKSKIIFILLIFLLKSSPCWLTPAKLHHCTEVTLTYVHCRGDEVFHLGLLKDRMDPSEISYQNRRRRGGAAAAHVASAVQNVDCLRQCWPFWLKLSHIGSTGHKN